MAVSQLRRSESLYLKMERTKSLLDANKADWPGKIHPEA